MANANEAQTKRRSGWLRKIYKAEQQNKLMQEILDRCFARLGKAAMAEILKEVRNGR
jgi:hypothetical protein